MSLVGVLSLMEGSSHVDVVPALDAVDPLDEGAHRRGLNLGGRLSHFAEKNQLVCGGLDQRGGSNHEAP